MNKRCACGQIHKSIPKEAKYSGDCVLPGFYFNCACGSTLVVPTIWGRIKRAFIILVALLISACADDDGGGDKFTCATLAGTYYNQFNHANTMTVAGNCTFTDSHCGYDASYTLPDSNGDMTVTVNNTNGTPACMSNTTHACNLMYNGVQLGIDCDGGAHQFLFIRQ